jgi:hypothetical protein
MAVVLCTGVDKMLLQTRQLLLEKAGHTVVVVMDENTLFDVCQKHSFDVAVIGQTVTSKMKSRIAMLIRERCPYVKLLELYPPYIGKVLDDADAWLAVPAETPNELADYVADLAKRGKQKPTKT